MSLLLYGVLARVLDNERIFPSELHSTSAYTQQLCVKLYSKLEIQWLYGDRVVFNLTFVLDIQLQINPEIPASVSCRSGTRSSSLWRFSRFFVHFFRSGAVRFGGSHLSHFIPLFSAKQLPLVRLFMSCSFLTEHSVDDTFFYLSRYFCASCSWPGRRRWTATALT